MSPTAAKSPHVRRSLRLQLIFALGLLSALLAIVVITEVVSRAQLQAATHRAISIEGAQGRLADRVALQALQCRRYEKDVFLNLDNASVRSDYLAKWNDAYTQLGQAIDAYAAATESEERGEAEVWRSQSATYRAAFLQVVQQITSGAITTPQAANAAITPFKVNIRALTDSSVASAQREAKEADEAASELTEIDRDTELLIILVGTVALVIAVVWSFAFPARLMHPIAGLHRAVERLAGGDLTARVAVTRDDELGALAQGFNQMAATIQQSSQDLEAEYRSARTARDEAEEAHDHIAAQLTTIEHQRTALRQLSVPILPLTETTLVMPLVGEFDTDRLSLAKEQALQALERMAAHYLIVDITGVPIIDSPVAHGLIQIVRAARLLGAEVVLVGMRPEVAETIVGVGIDLDSTVSCSTLQDGISYALQQSPLSKWRAA